jgi:hypothetical protein
MNIREDEEQVEVEGYLKNKRSLAMHINLIKDRMLHRCRKLILM